MDAYRVWECQICGWIYDESRGWPDDGIAPGTRWEDIPDDWACPECGAAKEDFVMLEITPAAKSPQTQAADAPTPTPTTSAPAQPSAPASRIWECMVCGWVYDEAKGWPEDGIAPGTRWEDIPEDWCCPQCGVGKEEFDMVLVSEGGAETTEEPVVTPSIDTEAAPLVIIGTGLAGYNLAREFRKLDQQTPLVMITSDDGGYYSKPLLSASLAHGKSAQQLATASAEEMARELHAEIYIHTHINDIDPASHTLTLVPDNGSHASTLVYGKLVLATGASCRPLPAIDGDGLARIKRINNLSDYHGFRTALINRRRVLLLGAGLIGCEFANDLVQSGFDVEVVDPLAWPLATLLPEQAGRDLQRALESAGARFHSGRSVVRIDSTGTGIRAELDDGTIIDADLGLAALGLQANTLLAEAAGLRVERGICTDRYLRTSDDNIFALGDCAEVDGLQLYFVAPLMQGARALARTLSGEPTSVQYGSMPVAVKTTLRPTTVCPPAPGASGDWQVQADSDGVRAEFREAGGQLLGFALTGNRISHRDDLAGECAPLMRDKD